MVVGRTATLSMEPDAPISPCNRHRPEGIHPLTQRAARRPFQERGVLDPLQLTSDGALCLPHWRSGAKAHFQAWAKANAVQLIRVD
jgi:hypothetical protein